jgi:hypothetical protein
MDDLFIKVFSKPESVGIVVIILFTILAVVYFTFRFAGKTITSVTADKAQTNEILDKMIELSASHLEVGRETKKAVENNTSALNQFAITNSALQTTVDRLDKSVTNLADVDMKEAVETALKPVEILIKNVLTVGENTQICLQELQCQLLQVMTTVNNLTKVNENGESNDPNPDPSGSSS